LIGDRIIFTPRSFHYFRGASPLKTSVDTFESYCIILQFNVLALSVFTRLKRESRKGFHMCGIACLIGKEGKIDGKTLDAFTDAVAHRGPDGRGTAAFARRDGRLEPLADIGAADFEVGLGHRRLSILDLSDAGAQPMSSRDGKLHIVYNGEVYNHVELRSELESEGFSFKSHCDTEVVLAAYSRWGMDCFRRFNGMWALAILDMERDSIIVSRDRFGIKPLYYLQRAGSLSFASEIKQFRHLPGFSPQPNNEACVAYLVNGYEIPPDTFVKDVKVFPAAHSAEIKLDSSTPAIEPKRFWNPSDVEILRGSDIGDAIEDVGRLFGDAVRLRLRSDVPVGSCLSGGLDSSAIFVEMGRLEPDTAFSAFSACFDDPAADERHFMEIVVNAVNSKHVKVFPAPDELSADFSNFLEKHDEPVGSVSIYAQHRVMKAARNSRVPVLLDGQGGDELFSGYWPTYFLYLDGLRKKGDYGKLIAQGAGAALPGGNRQLLLETFGTFSEYRKRSNLDFPYEIDPAKSADFAEHATSYQHYRTMTPEEYRIFELTELRLPRLLKWEDRNSMAFSIESRVPFLDIKLVERILSIPPEMNMRRGWTKYLFRKAMEKKLPRKIVWRKDKKGFETPQAKWSKRGPFHERLIDWTAKKEHPVSEYINTPFAEIADTVKSGRFDSTSLFRLYCLDEFLNKL